MVYLAIYFFTAYSGSLNAAPIVHFQKQFVTEHNTSIDGVNQQLSENNETENDDDVEITVLKLPFLLSFLQLNVSYNPLYHITHNLAETLTNPIYISVCNFRI